MEFGSGNHFQCLICLHHTTQTRIPIYGNEAHVLRCVLFLLLMTEIAKKCWYSIFSHGSRKTWTQKLEHQYDFTCIFSCRFFPILLTISFSLHCTLNYVSTENYVQNFSLWSKKTKKYWKNLYEKKAETWYVDENYSGFCHSPLWISSTTPFMKTHENPKRTGICINLTISE